jgi:FkbM family methyltransferase
MPSFEFKSYWLDSSDTTETLQSPATKLISLFNDDISKRILEKILNYRSTGEMSFYPSPSTSDEYTPWDIPKYLSPLRLIDCGACTGSAVSQFRSKGYELDSLIAFEPDLGNFEKLSRNLQVSEKIKLIPAGVWSRTEELSFSSNGGLSSSINESGTTQIKVVAIDGVVGDFSPNLIKFDVEGDEMEALLGSKQTILKHRPNLCVSVYHKPSDLFEIPMLIQSWNLGYLFYLRVHEHNTFGTVLYCLNPDLLSV